MARSKNDISAGEWRQMFLTALRGAGIVLDACKIAGVSRWTVYEWRKTDKEFAAAWVEAMEEATDKVVVKLEAKLQKLALNGDVRALEIALSALRPHQYGRRRIEATGRDGGPMEFRNADPPTDDELGVVIALALVEAKKKGKTKKGERHDNGLGD